MFESNISAPSARCFRSSGVCLTGMCAGPASVPRLMGCTGGRAVVDPRSPAELPVCTAAMSTKFLWHIFPWQGPMVTVL